jgi:hypothetical protein
MISVSRLGQRIKTEVIREHWGEILRLVASLKAGTVAPSAMLRNLAAYRRQNKLDLALQEFGRMERTLFTSACPAIFSGIAPQQPAMARLSPEARNCCASAPRSAIRPCLKVQAPAAQFRSRQNCSVNLIVLGPFGLSVV